MCKHNRQVVETTLPFSFFQLMNQAFYDTQVHLMSKFDAMSFSLKPQSHTKACTPCILGWRKRSSLLWLALSTKHLQHLDSSAASFLSSSFHYISSVLLRKESVPLWWHVAVSLIFSKGSSDTLTSTLPTCSHFDIKQNLVMKAFGTFCITIVYRC